MGNIYIVLGGGGGISSDEANAVSSYVLAGKTYLGADTNDDIGIGTMPNNPAQNVSLNCGQSVTVPLGYNPGSIITANSLASQTGGATADDSKVLSSYTYWKDGIKRTGNLSVTSVVSFNVAQYSNLTLIASWALPVNGPWSGLRIMCKQEGYPSNINDGTLFYEGSGTSALNSLVTGTWYFRAWNYMNTSIGKLYGNYTDQTVTNNQIRGQQAFTTSGMFTVPSNVYSVTIFCVGGGGSGGWGSSLVYPYDAGGGGGGYTNTGIFNVTPGQQLYITIGAGGENTSTANGGTTSVNGLISTSGGNAGQVGFGGNGGSGGGSADGLDGIGGSDGGNGGGQSSKYMAPGTGQGHTTRAFGESTNTLYAGGGGSGYASDGGTNTPRGSFGGAGGGGNGSGASRNASVYGTPGAFGTGGGGGGGCSSSRGDHEWRAPYGPGGSGIAIIRWGY